MNTWKKYIFSLALTLCCLGTLQASTWESYSSNSTIGRQRIDQVIIDENGVFLLIDGCWIGSQGMQATLEGIFILESGEWISLQEAIRCDNYYVWQCRKCKAWNPEGTFRCINCGKPR